ncbi:glycosyltransferase family 4 protein [Planctomycetota bacterium]
MKYEDMVSSLGIQLYPCINHWPEWTLLKKHYDLGIFEFYHTALWYQNTFKRMQPWSVTIVDSVDVHFARMAMACSQGLEDYDVVEAVKRDELSVYRQADMVLVVTEEDGDHLGQEGITNIEILPNIIPVEKREFGLERQPIVLFVGGFGHPPNIDAVEWLIESIWPEVVESYPDAELQIVGSNMPDDLKDSVLTQRNTRLLGFVEDLAPVLHKATVSVAPLRYGGGMKGKVNQAMACGLPVVSTSVGLQGIPGEDGKDYHCADDSRQFANLILKVLQSHSEQEKLGRNGQGLSDKVCGQRRAEECLLIILDKCNEKMSKISVSYRRRVLRWWTFSTRVLGKILREASRQLKRKFKLN